MAKELIYVADDFGMSAEINDAIHYTHVSGKLNAAALMMAQPATEAAVAVARACPSLQIGWHLHLCDSIPATVTRWPWGRSPTLAGVAIGISKKAQALMRDEVARQWELFQATGLECRLINSHHHLHAHPAVYRAILDVVGPQFQGWVRLGLPRVYPGRTASVPWAVLNALYLERRRKLSRWRTPDTLWGVSSKLNAKNVRETGATLPDGFHEFLFHPRTRTCPDSLCLILLKALSTPS